MTRGGRVDPDERGDRLLGRLPSDASDPAAFFVPGRVEVVGKHTDYAGGRSLVGAIDRGFRVAVGRTPGRAVRVTDVRSGETVVLAAGGGAASADPTEAQRGTRPGWAVYPETVYRRVVGDFGVRPAGCRILVESDLPPAAGLSSSSALIVAVFLALEHATGLSGSTGYRDVLGSPERRAAYLAAVERGSAFPGLPLHGGAARASGVGTRGGGEDHTAILCARDGALVQYSFEPTRRERAVPFPGGWVLAIGGSGVVAEKTGAARERYNRLSDEARRIAALWREATGGAEPHLGAILAPGSAAADRLMDVLRTSAGPHEREALEREALERRARHFIAESTELVPAAGDALSAGDLETFGRVVDRSQALADTLLRNQVPETVHLARSARRLGAAASSAFGAGFGGAVWAMVPGASAGAFLESWRDDFTAAFPRRARAARFFTTRPGPPARGGPVTGSLPWPERP